MVLLKIDVRSATPVFRQIMDGLSQLMAEGALPIGARLPATRVLAKQLGVNRSTVYHAYQELWAQGYLESRPGSYSTVRERPTLLTADQGDGDSLVSWPEVSSRGARALVAEFPRFGVRPWTTIGPGMISFADLSADRGLCPIADFRRALKIALQRDGGAVLGYGDPAGYPPLRELIARRMRTHGIAVTADEVLITNGSQNGIEMVLKLLVDAGDRVIIESPTYGTAIPLFRFHGAELCEVPLRTDGLDLDELERRLVERPTKLVYTVPNFQNPTGITTSQAHRERLLALCERHRAVLLEDGFEEEMKYFGKAVLPIKSMDRHGIVIYLGTFSKVIFPGLRIGWVVAERECILRLVALTRFCSLSNSTLGQVAMARFCEQGAYEAYLRRLHRAYRKRMQLLLRLLRTRMPSRGVYWTEPAGGYTLWVTVEAHDRTEADLERTTREHGVMVVPGSMFFASPPAGLYFRLSIANMGETEISVGVERLGHALSALVGR
jgi:DNA-binding transcriptional MocR family regulator